MEWPAPKVQLQDCQLNWDEAKKHVTTTISTTKPLNPVLGQKFYYSPQANVLWEFTWLGGQWIFTGGGPMTAGPSGAISMNSTTPTTPGSGPSLTIPFNGIYDVDWGAYSDIQTTGPVLQIFVDIYLNGAQVGRMYNTSRGGGGGMSQAGPVTQITATATHLLDFRLSGSVALNTYYGQDFWLELTPLKLT
jgi:hypothetical protein